VTPATAEATTAAGREARKILRKICASPSFESPYKYLDNLDRSGENLLCTWNILIEKSRN
jgi:hypothetical protein